VDPFLALLHQISAGIAPTASDIVRGLRQPACRRAEVLMNGYLVGLAQNACPDVLSIATKVLAEGATHCARDEHGVPVLHVAARHGNADVVEVLCAAGADLLERADCPELSLSGAAPSHFAVAGYRANEQGSYERTLRALLARGATLSEEDDLGEQPADIAMRNIASTGDRSLVDFLIKLGVRTLNSRAPVQARQLADALAKKAPGTGAHGFGDLPAGMRAAHAGAVVREAHQKADRAAKVIEDAKADPSAKRRRRVLDIDSL
jgi:Ankyrin repeat